MEPINAFHTAKGYAWAMEDATGTKTVTPEDNPDSLTGDHAFANAYQDMWQAHNSGTGGMAFNIRDAYRAWQTSRGATLDYLSLSAKS